MSNSIDQRRLRAGIVGGGRGAFIGAVHRIAAQLDSEAAGRGGRAVVGPGHRAPPAPRTGAWRAATAPTKRWRATEANLPDGIDFVIIATPNHLHLPGGDAPSSKAGIHVMCDKPLAVSVAERPGVRARW